MCEASGCAIEEQQNDVGGVVKMAHDAVVATGKQQVAVVGAGGIIVYSPNDARWATPDETFAIESTHAVTLRIGVVVEGNHGDT